MRCWMPTGDRGALPWWYSAHPARLTTSSVPAPWAPKITFRSRPIFSPSSTPFSELRADGLSPSHEVNVRCALVPDRWALRCGDGRGCDDSGDPELAVHATSSYQGSGGPLRQKSGNPRLSE